MNLCARLDRMIAQSGRLQIMIAVNIVLQTVQFGLLMLIWLGLDWGWLKP